MPQLSVYIEEALNEELRSKAKEKGMSLSSFVSEALKGHMDDNWPEDFSEGFGSLEDDPMEAPEELPWSSDVKRDVL